MELISGFIWGWSFASLNWKVAFFTSILVSLLLVISFIDYRTMVIPLSLIILCGVLILLSILFGILPFKKTLIGFLVGPLIFIIILGITFLISKRQSMGFGDVQLSAILGAWLGSMDIIFVFSFSSLLSLIWWLILSIKTGFNRDKALPFAPFLCFTATGIFIAEFYLGKNLFEILFIY